MVQDQVRQITQEVEVVEDLENLNVLQHQDLGQLHL